MALPPDAVVLSAEDAAELSDRVYQVRCAAEDVATALDEGAGAAKLRELCEVLIRAADGWAGWASDRVVPPPMVSRVQSRHRWRASPRGPGVPHVDADPPTATGSIGRFEILQDLDILTSDILGSDSNTNTSLRAVTSVTQRTVASGGPNRPMSGEGY